MTWLAQIVRSNGPQDKDGFISYITLGFVKQQLTRKYNKIILVYLKKNAVFYNE